jgi:hypothetical protein
VSEASLEWALDRLLLCNQIRELAASHAPVKMTDVRRTDGFVAGVVRRVYRSGKGVKPTASTWRLLRCVLLDICVVVWLQLLWCRGRVWRIARTTLGAIGRNMVFHTMRYYARPSSEITGYVRSTDKEAPLIRVCLLLRTMKRYGACIEFLIQRFHSGLPAEQTRRWLAFFLREIGDRQAADSMESLRGYREAVDEEQRRMASNARHAIGATPRRLTYGVVIPAMFDSAVFRSSVLSLVNSDFRGEIVVVEEGHQPAQACASFCRQLPVTYIKNPRWTGPSGTVNRGLARLTPETDVAIYAHSEVLWPPQWFSQLDEAWEQVYDFDKVGILNLGYLQFRFGTDLVLDELFINGRYAELAWLLRAMRESLPLRLMEQVQTIDMGEPGRRFGLATDAWNKGVAELNLMTGRFSVAASFPLRTWKDLGGFEAAIPFGIDLELQYAGLQKRQWTLWINNRPLIHLVSADTQRLCGDDRATINRMHRQTYEDFAKKYGVEIDHFLYTYFAETSIIYHDEIVEALNGLRFADIEFVFDDYAERLKRKTLSSCELMTCHSRATCRYV